MGGTSLKGGRKWRGNGECILSSHGHEFAYLAYCKICGHEPLGHGDHRKKENHLNSCATLVKTGTPLQETYKRRVGRETNGQGKELAAGGGVREAVVD